MTLLRISRLALILSLCSALAGCSVQELRSSDAVPAPDSAIALHGRAMGGQQPVTGATIKLYKVSTSGDGAASSSMLSSGVTTASDGTFSITSDYTCGSATEVFLVLTGGNPGQSSTNPNLELMAALGPCSGLSSISFVGIDEVSTVAAVAALQPYMSAPTSVGSSSYDAGALAADFTTAAELAALATGTSPGTGIPSGYTVPSSLINTLADIITPCVNSTGGTAGSSTLCGSLFTYATPPGGTAPTDTTTAVLDILNHPTLNTSNLFGLITAQFQPALTSAPSTFTIQVTPPSSTVTRTFYAFPESDLTVTPLYALVNNAQSTIDMTMYELVDTTFSGDLVNACKRGVKVRVILDQNDEKSSNTAAYNQLNAQTNCSAAWANPQFQVTHEKSMVIDGTTAAILSLNLVTADYSETRDFAEVENDAYDVAAMEATFNSDYGSTTDFSYLPGSGDNELIWSPTTAQASLVNLIKNATQTLWVENEEMSASNVVTALENACGRGVTVNITMTNDDNTYASEFTALVNAGCNVHTYVDNSSTLYIHAKVILADYGTSGVAAYFGSINFSTASMVENRELGMYVTDAATQQTLHNTLVSDYNGGTNY